MRIKDEYINKIDFRTQYGNYEFVVFPFGLSNPVATFMWLMKDIFRHYLDQFVMVFLNYILIYSKSVEEHEEHMILVLQVLSENHLYAKLSKCPFYHKQIQYLGHIIS